ncbi:accessory Sec system S-layer assembly protein [Bacillus luti]|uniref:accessory Sec system S-layer assembly protein n=1 Tax=Bacillus luti TaxID=2026191 RepID=UPI0008FE8ED0|nr:accessory Sec system S-layer assembly protein [Bacillus luti]OJE51418.1 accessory Sec system S-layer assembly protein [Bacillus luti]
MLSFLKKARKKGKDSVISSSQLLGVESDINNTKNVKPNLYFHPSWNEVSQEQKYIYQFLHKSLPTLQENQISLAGIESKKHENAYYITTFIRSSVKHPIQFETFTLSLLNKDGETCARQAFDLSLLEEIPSNVNMPWTFVFEENSITEATLSTENWQLVFELKEKHSLDLDPIWQERLSESAIMKLQEIVANLTPPEEGEINLLGLNAAVEETGDLNATILIRNGYNQNITLEQLPLHIADCSGAVVAEETFTLKDFQIKANSTKPWTFTFPAASVSKETIDLSKWTAFIPQQS